MELVLSNDIVSGFLVKIGQGESVPFWAAQLSIHFPFEVTGVADNGDFCLGSLYFRLCFDASTSIA